MVTKENTTKDEQAYTIASSHYQLEPEIDAIIRIVGPNEEDAREPVKMLEVNSNTVQAGIIPVSFGAHPPSGAPYPTVIVEVTPKEFEDIKSGQLPLRDGWKLGSFIARPPSDVNGISAHA